MVRPWIIQTTLRTSSRNVLLALLITLSALLAPIAHAQSHCRQALALGLDVSGSVDSREYKLQLHGLAAALNHREVSEALLSMPGTPVHIAIFEWSGPGDQTLIQPWVAIDSLATLQRLAQRLQQVKRTPSEQSTALGQAMLFGSTLLSQRKDCWTRTLDISGDGKSNTGMNPQNLPPSALDSMTINALVIGADPLDHGDSRQAEIGELSAYFNAYVIHGVNSFVEVALGFEDYERAMVRKLKRELQGFALSQPCPLPGPGVNRCSGSDRSNTAPYALAIR